MIPLSRESLPDGIAGTGRTIQAMQSLAFGAWGSRSPRIRALALDIVREAGVPERDYLGEVRALHGWVVRSLRYVRDPINQELLTAPETLLEVRAGDCDDHAVLLAALLAALGHAVRFVTIGFDANRPESFSHVYLHGQPAGSSRWVPLDAIKKDQPAGWEAPAPVRRIWPDLTKESAMIAGICSDLGRFRMKSISRAVKSVARAAVKVAAAPIAIAAPIARPVIRPMAKIAAPITRPVIKAVNRLPPGIRNVAAVAAAPATGGAALLATTRGARVVRSVRQMVKRPAAPPAPVAAPVVDPETLAARAAVVTDLRTIAQYAGEAAETYAAQAQAQAQADRNAAAADLRALAEQAGQMADNFAAQAQEVPAEEVPAEVVPAEEVPADAYDVPAEGDGVSGLAAWGMN